MLDGAEHTDGDAWVLTAMLLVPRAVVHTRSLSAIAEVAWAPAWFVRLAVPPRNVLARSGLRKSASSYMTKA
jgi:hypothetical protein